MATPDYIIVGGGTAGLVLANRLTENPDIQVLVLEAGTDMTADPRVKTPGLWTILQGSELDWQYQSVPQEAMNGRRIREPQGKLLGGSSGINGQAFIAPGKGGIDAWAKKGSPGWDFDTLGPYYKKSYTLVLPEDQETRDYLGIDWVDEMYQGDSGPLRVGFPGVKENPLIKAWLDAFRDEDKITNADPFSGESIGGYSNLASVDPATKTRSYSATAYGLPAMQRPNLRVVFNTNVQKILFADATVSPLKATGVLATIDGKTEELKTNKEVLLAAGVFNTPKLLELSELGNKNILSKFGINTFVDLPGVGENLQDHLMTGVSYEVIDGVVTGDALMRQEPEALKTAQELYFEHRAGPLTIGGVQSNAFMSTEDAGGLLDKYPPKPEDREIYDIVRGIYEEPNPGASAVWFMFLAQANLHEGAKSFVGTRLLPNNFASLGCSQSHPLSRGNTHIGSSNAEDAPVIDPAYFSHPADLEIMARHVQGINKLREANALDPFFKKDGQRNHPDAYKVDDLEEAKKYVLDTATTTFHSCGTAALLPREKRGVVDPELKVYGTEGLRIVDSSIIPLIPRGNVQSTVYAVAERAADIIKGI